MRKFKMPTAFTVLFVIILLMTVLTWSSHRENMSTRPMGTHRRHLP